MHDSIVCMFYEVDKQATELINDIDPGKVMLLNRKMFIFVEENKLSRVNCKNH